MVFTNGHQRIKGAIDRRWCVVPAMRAIFWWCGAGNREGGVGLFQRRCPLWGELTNHHKDITRGQFGVRLMVWHGLVLELMSSLLAIKGNTLCVPAKLKLVDQ